MTDIETIKERNARVEAEKAWETSWTRRILIALITYIVIGAYLTYLEIERAWLHAFVPATAYILSTLGLHYVKLLWMKSIYKKEVFE
ncbi:MAG: hypothetical protein H6861_03940 [Rhodospirillales bacterium]|nr:hypothetical protein [Rhodospirillales bacterium]